MIWLPKKDLILPHKQRGFITTPGSNGAHQKGNLATDANFASVVSLLHCDGTDEAMTYTDVTGKTWTPNTFSWTFNGNAQIDTAQSLYGGSSLLLDGSGDYLSGVDSSVYEFGSGDYTVEASIRLAAVGGGNQTIASKYQATASARAWILSLDSTANTISWTHSSNGTSNSIISASFTWAANTWYKVAVSRVGSTVYIFVDGTLITSGSAISIHNNSAVLRIGARESGGVGAYLNGWVDEFRMTVGVGRYSATYTPQSAAFPNNSADPYAEYVPSLLHFGGADGATTVTEHGFVPHVDVNQSVYGGASLFFSGNNQYITTSTGADFNFGSGDLTVEAAIRCPDVSLTQYVFTTRGTGGTAIGITLYVSGSSIGAVAWDSGGSTLFNVTGGTVVNNTWHRIAFVRSGNTGYLFVDGAKVASGSFTGTVGNAATVQIGHDPSPAGPRNFKGFMDEIRVTKGVARYTTNYGVRPKAFADS